MLCWRTLSLCAIYVELLLAFVWYMVLSNRICRGQPPFAGARHSSIFGVYGDKIYDPPSSLIPSLWDRILGVNCETVTDDTPQSFFKEVVVIYVASLHCGNLRSRITVQHRSHLS